MGSGKSKSQGASSKGAGSKGASSKGAGSKGAGSKGAVAIIPQDVVPYQGFKVQYHLLDVLVTMQSNMTFNFSPGAAMTSTNIDSYYPLLAQVYNEGFRLQSFYRIPGAAQRQGFMSMAVNIPFQGIFTRFLEAPPSEERWQLKVEKSMMQVHSMITGIIGGGVRSQSDTSDLLNKIKQNTDSGGRLICVEITGMMMTQGMAAAMTGISAGIGVDLFFELPMQPSPCFYTYQVVNVPIAVTVQMGFPAGRINVSCDWQGQLNAFLQQGWRLVEIFLDQGAAHQGGFSMTSTMNSLWFFEKETNRINDTSPVYEGIVVEYKHEVKGGLTGMSAPPMWGPILEEMGSRGWELACILDTPDQRMTGFAKIKMRLQMFFQRKISNELK